MTRRGSSSRRSAPGTPTSRINTMCGGTVPDSRPTLTLPTGKKGVFYKTTPENVKKTTTFHDVISFNGKDDPCFIELLQNGKFGLRQQC